MLSNALSEVRNGIHERLLEWAKETLADSDLCQWASEAIELKEDYDRALAVRLGYESICDDWEKSLDAMAALELLDASLLVVDDIVDDSPRRMGKKTLHEREGQENAIILANVLRSTSMLALLKSAGENLLTQTELLKLMESVEQTFTQMYVGEYLDMMYEDRSIEEVSIDDYLEMIKRTTGIHFGMALKVGGILSRGTEIQIENLWNIGVRLGTILQIRDDFIDYLDVEELSHKPSFGDFQRRKKRLPLLLAYQFFPEEVKRLQNTPLDGSAKAQIQSLIAREKIKLDVVASI
jgi:geranylgeranyl pyrophosphate synthase